MRNVVRICLFLTLIATAWAQSPQSVLDTATQALQDRTLLLRGFPTGSKLKYTNEGEPIHLKTGIWTVHGFLHVDRIEEKGGELRIYGQRHLALYDSKSEKWELRKYNEKAELRIPEPDAANIDRVLKKIFILQPDHIADSVPQYWRHFLERGAKDTTDPPKADKTPASERACEPPEGGVYKICKGVKAPQLTSQVEPEFPEWPRKLGLTGMVKLTTILGTDGVLQGIEIARPCGAGLDEQAIAAVSRWRFKPAMKDGKPVPVRTIIEVEFHLY